MSTHEQELLAQRILDRLEDLDSVSFSNMDAWDVAKRVILDTIVKEMKTWTI